MSESEPESVESFPIVAVGASAGGIEAFSELLKALPDKPGIGFVFVLHQDPKHESNLAQVIARATKMPVQLAGHGTPVQVNHVYVLPPNAEGSLEGGVIRLRPRTTGTSIIDTFFRSVAEDQGGRAISIVLSGTASDGTRGTKEVKAEGGITFAQDRTAKMDGMPQSAIAAGYVDFVLPPREIAEELLRIARHDYMRQPGLARLPDAELARLFTLIRQKHDIDFTHYKPSTIERRIRRRMALRKVDSLDDYLKVVRDDVQEIEQLYGDILIKVTGFFRDPEVFKALERDVFPRLVEHRDSDDRIRAWVPGCATGEEVYSLAISLIESAAAHDWTYPIQIFGTDVSELAVERARAGLYPESIAAEVSPERLRRFFNRVPGGYRISKSVRDCCIFAWQNVAKDPPFSKLDLISCRNVMIYFGSVLQRRVLSIFNYALRPEGFLLLGSSETIGNFADLFGVVDRKNKIYRKKTAVARTTAPFDMVKPVKPIPEHQVVDRDILAPNPIFREADRVLLDRFTPSGVLINENLDILQFRGRTSHFLEPPSGTASFNLLKMAREGLLADLRAAIHTARKKDAPQRREGLRVKVNDHVLDVNIEVIPFVGVSKERFMIVLFEEAPQEKKGRLKKKKNEPAEPVSKQSERLKRELEATREYLQSIIEDQEAMNEELRSANEEIQSSNEELQSTNEEMETAKEELQSSNEELTTLNEELENRNVELAEVNNDLINLLASVEIPIVMVKSDLRIRRFNPSAQRRFNLNDSDLDRPLTDINTKLPLDGLGALVTEVLETLEVREVEIKDKSGRVQSLRVRPYRTTDNKIDGAVLVLLDVEEFRRKGSGLQRN